MILSLKKKKPLLEDLSAKFTLRKAALLSFVLLIILASCKKTKPEDKDDSGPITETPDPPSENKTSLVYIGSNNKLAYNAYANEGETDKINTLPDFSFSGYKGGGVSLPELPVKKTINPVPGDNRLHIQQAIDELESLAPDVNGFRGALLLKAGTYEVEGTLTVEKSGVVLRGEGQGLNGTIIKATKRAQHTLIELVGAGSGIPEISSTRKTITDTYVPTGSKTIQVQSASGLAVGDPVVVARTPNDAWIDMLNVRQYGWTASGYKMTYERKIVAIAGNKLTLDAPIVDPIQTRYGGGYVCKTNISGRIQNSGVENLRLVSVYNSDDDEEHGWYGIELKRTENCWVKKVTAQYFGYSCVSIGSTSVYNTVEECAMIDIKSQTTGGRKYSFNLEGGASFNLFQRCFADGGRHDFVTGSKVPGPNVFLDCFAANTTSDIGPHHRWSTGLLFDNVHGGMIRVQNRGFSGSGHGWAGAQTLFFNCKSYSDDIKVDSPGGARNWGIGCVGLKQNGNGYWESWGTPVTPRSLYLAQLSDRLGQSAVNNITTAAQRSGTIANLLALWKGEGRLPAQ